MFHNVSDCMVVCSSILFLIESVVSIFASMRGNWNAKIRVQQMAAVASEMDSAANTPLTPQKLGRISANGTKRITFRSSAMNTEIFAAPKATNMFWQARCRPNMLIPVRNMGSAVSTV